MAVAALLLALTVGATAAPAMSVFGFMTLLTSLFVMGLIAAVALSDHTGSAVAWALVLFASAQVGYGLALTVLARLDHRRPTGRRRHFRIRK